MSDGGSSQNLPEKKARLELERDIAKLRAETASFAVPWWRRPSIVTGIATLLGATIPLTTAISGTLQSEKEVKLASLKFAEDVRGRYLDRMKDESERQRTLRFLVATTEDESIRRWATAELVLVDNEVAKVKARIAELEKKSAETEEAFRQALTNKPAEAATLGQQVQTIAREKATLQSQLKAKPAPVEAPPFPRSDLAREDPCVATCMLQNGYIDDGYAGPMYRMHQKECAAACGLAK